MKHSIVIFVIVAFLFSSLHSAPERKKKLTDLKKDTSTERTTTTDTSTGETATSLKDRLANRSSGQGGEVVKAKMSPAQQQNVQKLMNDLNTIKAGSQVTPQQIQKLQQDLFNMVDGATKPSQQSVQELATDLANVWADGKITPKEQKELMDDVYAILNSANISVSEAEAVIADAQTILQASGLSASDVQTISNDLKAIANELQKNTSTTTSSKKFPRLKH